LVEAPGRPGIPPRWTSSAKSGVGCAISETSRVWFTISHGILNEVYYPRVDQACIRDLGLIVTDGESFFAEEKRDCTSNVDVVEDGVPAFLLTSTHCDGRFQIVKRVIADPRSESVLMHVRFEVLSGGPLRLFALLAPHLVNGGAHNKGWRGSFKGQELLFAEGDGSDLAMGGEPPFLATSIGFVGVSDGWGQLSRHFQIVDSYDSATDGNIGMTAELQLDAKGEAVLALGFGRSANEAAFHARNSLQTPFDVILKDYITGWRGWQADLRPLDRRAHGHNMYRVSTTTLHCHETRTFAGGVIASLSIPWGFSKGDDDLGGYHLVWPRDLCETGGALLACGDETGVRRIVRYLRAIQEADGSWPQNCWLDGSVYWGGVQLDECAFPMLLLDMAWREGAFRKPDLQEFWPMVKSAAGFVLRNGPRTKQDRWEENAGYTPFTLAVTIASLLGAADYAEACEAPDADAIAGLLRDTADAWNEQIEDWVYVENGALSAEAGVPGYYMRIAPESPRTQGPDPRGEVQVRNHEAGTGVVPADALVSTDALALVRFGLRAPDDPRIVNTIAVIDKMLKVDLPQGPGWRRYNLDGYGEKADGSPFDGVGIGRCWPLLAGERAHYAIAAGNRPEAESLLQTIEAQTSSGGLFPEQVWDAPPIPERQLDTGRPSGSAMPLVWAHSEYMKLLRSLSEDKVFDMPVHTRRRYVEEKRQARCRPWRKDCPANTLPAGHVLRLDLPEPSIARFTRDGWATYEEAATHDTGLGLHVTEIATTDMGDGQSVIFTWRNAATGAWQGVNHEVSVVG
jgi:glucoamylase